jgi:hypothetical protein
MKVVMMTNDLNYYIPRNFVLNLINWYSGGVESNVHSALRPPMAGLGETTNANSIWCAVCSLAASNYV